MSPLPPLPRPHSLLLAAAAIAALACPTTAQGLAKDRAAGAAAVDVAMCRQWLGTLAGEEFEGRGTGQPGYEKAANYVAGHFKALGLQARGENGSYFQHMPFGSARVVAEKTKLTFLKNGTEVLAIPAEQLGGAASTNLSASGDVVLVVVDPPPPRERPAGERRGFEVAAIPGLDQLDVKGKVVVVHIRAGKDGNARAGGGTEFAVRQGLAGKEAATILFATVEAPRGGLQGGTGTSRRGGVNPAAAGAARAGGSVSFGAEHWQRFLNLASITPEALAEAPLLSPVCLTASVEIGVEERQTPAMNVFAVLPGSDATKKDEYVVIGSHLDHLGVRGGRMHPGADDDGSGTTGVMAVAQMFAKNEVRPARSVLFVCFAGEEIGLRGSRYFADNCPVPLSSIVAELQMDMIGRDEEDAMDGGRHVNIGEKAEDNRNSVHLVGTQKLAPSLHALCLHKNEVAKLDIEFDQESLYSRSDHANFARHGVPIAFFFTGLHRDYHQVTDTPDKIHYEKLLRVATWVYDIAFELAIQPGRPEIDPKLWQEFRSTTRSAPEQPAAPLRAGK